MAPVIIPSGGGDVNLPGKLTLQVVCCSIIAAFGGLMFGYDIGISGGVTSMDDFLLKFFPDVYRRKHSYKEDNYCKYNSQKLQVFTSSLYMAAMVSSLFASFCCKKFGRKPTMQMAAFFFFIGVILNVAAVNLPMLIVGRLCLGAGVGFGNQAVPLFISEIAPAKYRGGLNICFQMMVTIGILIANFVNYGTSNIHPYGWRISLGGAAVPALFLGLGSLFIVETPASLIERGQAEEGLRVLKNIRGEEDVGKEYDEILRATESAKKIESPFRSLFKLSSFPQLFCGTILQVFQQFTGINVIMFYAPVLFQTMGLGGNASLLSAGITGCINSLATLVAIFGVDRVGRRFLLIEAAIQMFIAQGSIGLILAKQLHSTGAIPKLDAMIVIVLICVFVTGFAWSWGPLGWLIPSEIFPLETRTLGFSVAVFTNMACTFIIAQAFLTMLCTMKSTIFLFFAVWIIAMGLFAAVFLPETKGIPIDEMNDRVWKKHWFWRKFFDHQVESQV